MSANTTRNLSARQGWVPSRRWMLSLVVLALALAGLWFAANVVLQPTSVTPLVLHQIGKPLGLEITATGTSEYRLRGTPLLVVRDVLVHEPGAVVPILRAERVLLSLPWSTIRSRGAKLNLIRVELDAPILNVMALRHWLATRPPSETRMPVLSDGLRVIRGRIEVGDWHIDDVTMRLPVLQPQQPVNAQVSGRYADATTRIPFDVAIAFSHPGNGAGTAVVGSLTIEHDGWRLPASIKFTGPLQLQNGELNMQPARLSMAARYRSGRRDLPFAFALTGALQYAHATLALAPVGVALRGQSVLPDVDAHGVLALGQRLVVRLDGSLPMWPRAWPTLPMPLNESSSPLTFALRYVGNPDLSAMTRMQLQRDDSHFDGRFRLFDLLTWLDAPSTGSPLPPLSGHLTTPRLQISGVQFEGVKMTLDDSTGHAADVKHTPSLPADQSHE